MLTICIDPGIIHLGILICEVQEDGELLKIHVCKLENITEYSCPNDCSLHHDNCVADYVCHVYEKYKSYFQSAHKIFIERQPICGLVDVICAFQMLLSRDKLVLVSPNQIHAKLGMSKSYDIRKEQSVHKMKEYIQHLPSHVIEKMDRGERVHDLADCFLLLRIYQDVLQKEERLRKPKMIFEAYRFRKEPCQPTR